MRRWKRWKSRMKQRGKEGGGGGGGVEPEEEPMWVSAAVQKEPSVCLCFAYSCMSSSERKCIHTTPGSSNSLTCPTSQ